MRRLAALVVGAAVLTLPAGPPPVSIDRVPVARPSCPVGELAKGDVFELAADGLYQAVGPASGYSLVPSPPFPAGWEIPDPGPGRRWIVDLTDGTLTRMPVTWRAWPVSDSRLNVRTTHP